MTRKGRLESLKSLWSTRSSSTPISDLNINTPLPPTRLIPSSEHLLVSLPGIGRTVVGPGATLLHYATASGQEDIVSWLLSEQRADPTTPLPISSPASSSTTTSTAIPVPGSIPEEDEPTTTTTNADDENESADRPTIKRNNIKPYDLASTKSLRNIYRRAAHSHSGWYDWLGDGNVDSVLTPEMEEADARKKGARRKGVKERMKEREKEKEAEAAAEAETALERERQRVQAQAQAQAQKKTTGPQRLGGAGRGAMGAMGVPGGLDGSMTPEMRARIERERRARAAEARLGGGRG